MRRRKQHRHLTASDKNHNLRGAPRSVLGRSAPGFVYSSRDPSGITSDKTNKYPSPVTIINKSSGPSETPTKYTSHVTKELKISKPSNILIYYPSGYPTGATSTRTTGKTSSNPRAQPITDPYFTKRGRQEAHTSLQRYIIIFILNIISYLPSRKRATQTR